MKNKIREKRKEKGILLKELSKKLNISEVTLRTYENGTVAPKIDTVIELLNVLECEFWDLFCKQ